MSKALLGLSLLVFLTCCNSAVVKQKLKDQIREGELKEQQKVKIQLLDNDEEATTVHVVDPPIQNQFQNVVQNGVGQVDEDGGVEESAAAAGPSEEPEEKPEKLDEATTEKEKEDEDEEDEITSPKPAAKPRPLPIRTTQNRRVISTTEKVTDEDKEVEEEEKAETTEAPVDSEEEEEDEAVARKAKGKLSLGKNKSIRSVDCGYHRLKPGETISVTQRSLLRSESSKYSSVGSCIWKFFGHHCVVKTSCSCFDLPESLNCVEDHLKLSDMFSFSERFCGERKPSGQYNSTTNHLFVRFKSSMVMRTSELETRGFTCYVSCTGPGKSDPVIKPEPC